MDKETSTSTSSTDSGVQSITKRRKLEEKNTKQAIIGTMLDEVAKFGALVSLIVTTPERTDEDYRRLYRLYKAALKALNTLKTECDLEDELEALPSHAEAVLKSSDDNVKVWSQYFFINPVPAKLKNVKTVPSPATVRIGSLMHSIGSFFGLTAEAVCSNKRQDENNDHMKHLLTVAKKAIVWLEIHRDEIVKILEPFMKEKRDIQNANPGTINQNNE